MRKLRSNLISNSFLLKVIKFVNINSFYAIIRQRNKTITKKRILSL